eukprot:scaffold34687_cov207-Amphora_coffeaeformis.AAC.1
MQPRVLIGPMQVRFMHHAQDFPGQPVIHDSGKGVELCGGHLVLPMHSKKFSAVGVEIVSNAWYQQKLGSSGC